MVIGSMKKFSLVLSGYCVGLGGLLLITYRTVLAFGAEGKSITIYMNRFGEQYLDVVSLLFLWVVCASGLYVLLSFSRKETNPMGQRSEHGRGINEDASDVVFPFGSTIRFSTSPGVSYRVGDKDFSEGDSGYVFLENKDTTSLCSVSVETRENPLEG